MEPNNLFGATNAVGDILSPSPRPRSLEDNNNGDDSAGGSKYLNSANYFGLNLGRSQSAAPALFTGLTSPVGGIGVGRSGSFGEINRGSGGNDSINGGDSHNNGNNISGSLGTSDGDSYFFSGASTATHSRSRRHFFSDEDDNNDDSGDDVVLGIRRPASTGVIGRNNSNNNDVNSILETLGLTSLESGDDGDDNYGGNSRGSGSVSGGGNKALGGIGSYVGGGGNSTSAHTTPKKQSFDSMIHREGDQYESSSKAANYFTRREDDGGGEGNMMFGNQGGGGLTSPSAGSQGNFGQYVPSSDVSVVWVAHHVCVSSSLLLLPHCIPLIFNSLAVFCSLRTISRTITSGGTLASEGATNNINNSTSLHNIHNNSINPRCMIINSNSTISISSNNNNNHRPLITFSNRT